RQLLATGIQQRPRLQNPSLPLQRWREIGQPRAVEGGECPLRVAVGDTDHREVGGDLRLCHALETAVDLVLEEIRGLREEVHLYGPARQIADHLVAARTWWRQLLEIVVYAERRDRPHLVGAAVKIEVHEDALRLRQHAVDRRVFRESLGGLLYRLEAGPVLAAAEVEIGEHGLHV